MSHQILDNLDDIKGFNFYLIKFLIHQKFDTFFNFANIKDVKDTE